MLRREQGNGTGKLVFAAMLRREQGHYGFHPGLHRVDANVIHAFNDGVEQHQDAPQKIILMMQT